MGTGFTFDYEKCTECERCMATCSIVKKGFVQLQQSMIVIGKNWPELPEIRVCRFDDCKGHPCIASCPVEAISDKDGIILIDENTCTGCGACVEECPYRAIYMIDGIARKCDFCGGDPECVKACVTVAIAKKGG